CIVLFSPFILSFFFYCYVYPCDLHSFPTRRSSDLDVRALSSRLPLCRGSQILLRALVRHDLLQQGPRIRCPARAQRRARRRRRRSEEHTSELQSRGHLVCRLLLEKKNKYN